MAATRTQGITIDTDGNFTINKEYRGIRLFFRLGKLGQDQAEQRLQTEIDRVDCELERKAHARPRFAHCAARYLDESRDERSFDVIALHVRLLISHLGGLEVKQIHLVRSRVQGSQRRLRLTLDNGQQDHRGPGRLPAMLFPILNCFQLHTEQLSKLRLRQSGPLANHLDVRCLDLEDARGFLLATHNAARFA